ncbi:BTAD domain-containing putative transcriptional regulator [Spirillospora sp. CA-142024]|uniref:BTAD domain-containing putative transcriptional regulator n=1 Tax=Spirillospora sp. CA-142024 TaxID=3240036 RepID=UPI003D90CE9C
MTRTLHNPGIVVCRGLAALATLAALLIAIPITMYKVGGSPIPRQIPDWSTMSAVLMRPDTDGWFFLTTIRFLGWAAWCLFAATMIIEGLAYLAGRTASLPRPVQPIQVLVRDLVAAVTLAVGAAAAIANPASATTHTTAGTTAATPSPHTPNGISATPPHSTDPASYEQSVQIDVIEPGDTLWSIARRTYGSGTLYPKIFQASRALDQPDPLPPLTDPNELRPGQHIRLPQIRRHSDHHQHSPAVTPERTPPPPHRRAPAPDHTTHRPPHTEDHHFAPEAAGPAPATAQPAPAASMSPQPGGTTSPSPSVHDGDNGGDNGGDNAPNGIPSAFALPTGSRIGLGLAAAISLALAATRINRRRRHPGAGHQSASTTTEPAPPNAVANAHRAHLETYAERNQPVPTDAELLIGARDAAPPDSLTLGTRDDRPIALPLHGLNLSVSGDGAVPFARALATELLAKAHHDRAELVMPQPDAERIYPHLDATELPGLTITPSLDAAVARLEAEFVNRARLMETTDQPDITALRTHEPAEPLPTLLLVTSISEQTKHALNALIGRGHRYGIGSLVLGHRPTRATNLHLAGDGTVTSVDGPHADTLAKARLFRLTANDAADMLTTIRTAADDPATGASPCTIATPAAATAETDTDAESDGDGALVGPPATPDDATDRPARLHLLGAIRLTTANGPISTGLRTSARDLLAYLALNPHGITREQGTAALWPDRDQSSANDLLKTAISNARSVLRIATGLPQPAFIIRASGRYRLDPHLLDVDLWDLSATITRARQACNSTEHIQAVHSIADLYTADFADGLTYEWASNHRAYLHRTVINTIIRLANDLQNPHPDEATAALEHAIRHDPYAEPAYRSLMALEAHLGHHDAVQRTFELLTTRLADLGTEPAPQTHQLLADLQPNEPS